MLMSAMFDVPESDIHTVIITDDVVRGEAEPTYVRPDDGLDDGVTMSS